MTALCWTRCGYRFPPLIQQIWKEYWQSQDLHEHSADAIPHNLPKDWKNIPMICNNIIRACLFCKESPRVRNNIGNLKHLHLYCSSTHLKKARTHCYQKIELALQNLYDYASIIEFDCPLYECLQKTILQERMETAAREAELLSRPVI